MTAAQVIKFAKLLFEIIRFVRKNGGNRDTYILNKLTQCRDELIKEYPYITIERYFQM